MIAFYTVEIPAPQGDWLALSALALGLTLELTHPGPEPIMKLVTVE